MEQEKSLLLARLEEIDGEIELIHKAMCDISDPASDEYERLQKRYNYWLDKQLSVQSQLNEIYKRESESEGKKREHKGNILRIIGTVVAAVIGGVFSLGSQIYASKKHQEEFEEGLKFEETGTFTSTMNRGNVGRTPGAKKF